MDLNFYCLHCRTVVLELISIRKNLIAFYGCPDCKRRFAKSDEKPLSELSGAAIRYALYTILFSENLKGEGKRSAAISHKEKSPQQRALIVEEIKLELEYPSQSLTTILPQAIPHSDQVLRKYLREFIKYMK